MIDISVFNLNSEKSVYKYLAWICVMCDVCASKNFSKSNNILFVSACKVNMFIVLIVKQ